MSDVRIFFGYNTFRNFSKSTPFIGQATCIKIIRGSIQPPSKIRKSFLVFVCHSLEHLILLKLYLSPLPSWETSETQVRWRGERLTAQPRNREADSIFENKSCANFPKFKQDVVFVAPKQTLGVSHTHFFLPLFCLSLSPSLVHSVILSPVLV